MLILINPKACGGRALRKWEGLEPHLALDNARVHVLKGESDARDIIADALRRKETDFVAAGGDGTVNMVANHLLNITEEEDRGRIRLGAIGLGSSNDFHKPYDGTNTYKGIPVNIDFFGASPRDIGCLSFKNGSGFENRYFLVNASVGLVAEANRFFNNPDFVLRRLKKSSTPAAIAYAAMKTMVSYKEITVEIADDLHPARMVNLTLLGILKNLNFSGSFHWAGSSNYSDGLFQVRVCREISFADRLRLMAGCAKGTADTLAGVESYQSGNISVSSSLSFAVEYDGEVVETTFARFGVLRGGMNVNVKCVV